MNNIKIKFYAVSIGWDYGGIMSFDIKASAESNISVSWGNGKNTTRLFYKESGMVHFENDYFPSKISPPDGEKFLVEISSDDIDCRIFGFNLMPVDMAAIDLDVSNCPELEKLSYSGYFSEEPMPLDLSHNTALKYLYCEQNEFTSLDLSHNTALEELNCRSNRLSYLNLANNIALKKLDCEFNNMKQLYIYYAPQLIEAKIEECNQIDEATIAQIQALIEDNIK